MTTQMNPDLTLDQQGFLCPMPIINAENAISGLTAGQIMEVLCTDPGSKSDFKAWSRRRGHKILSESEEGSPVVYKFYIEKGG
ncbi:MAG: sulfurtransferase TusA family protein [Nitrososphaerales archaeon]